MNNRNGERAIIQVPAFEDLIDRVGSFDSFTVAGKLYSAEHLVPQLTINSADLVSEAASAAAFVLYWGLEAARSRRFHAQVEAAYRTWRDRTWLEIKATPGESTGKFPTDAQTEKTMHTSPHYGEWRGRLDDAQANAEMAEAVFEAFKLKGDLVKAAERIMAHEAGGAYYVEVTPRQTVARQPQQGE